MDIIISSYKKPNFLVRVIDDLYKNRSEFVCKKVSDRLFRGSNPHQQYDVLATKGVKTVLDLKSMSKKKTAKIAREVQAHGMAYRNIPLNPFRADKYYQDITRELYKASPAKPIFVHCEFGRDRTGFVCAIENVLNNGFSLEEALKDMHDNGFRKIFSNLERYLKKHLLA